MQPFDCLDSKTDIFGPHLLEASAGTGKTFAIEHLFVRFLLEVDIKEILVVTFTKAATAELKRRIFQNIEHAILAESHTFDYLLEIKKISNAKGKLKEALFAFDDAQIFTIHGFCQRMLAENFIEAGVYFDPETSTSKIKKTLLNYLRENIYLIGLHPFQMQILLKKYNGIDGLCDKLINDHSDVSHNTSDIGSGGKDERILLKKFSSKLLSYGQIFDKTKIYEKILLFFDSYKKTGFPSILKLQEELEILLDVLEKRECSEESLYFFLRTKFSVLSFFDQNNLKKNKEPLDLQIMKWAREELLPLVEDALNVSLLFATLQNHTHGFLNSLYEKEGYFSPDRILEKMREASLDWNFKKQIQSRYKVLIIDEFQDTDPVQWSIFKNLFLENTNLSALYLVGDPKQSIYRFRKADLYTYLQAQNVLGMDNVYHLTFNFRSHKSLISSLNAFFHEDFANKWLSLPKLDTYLDYHPVIAKKEEKPLIDHLAPLHFFVAEEKSKMTFPSKKTEEKMLFPFIYEEIVRLKKEGFLEKDFAVLVKDRFQARRIIDYLEEAGISCLARTTIDIRKSPTYHALKDLFEAVVYFPKISFLKKSLIGFFFDLDVEVVQNLEALPAYFSVLESFSQLKQIWDTFGLPTFFQELLQVDFLQDGRTIVDRLCKIDVVLFHDLKQIMELLLEYSQGRKTSGEKIFSLFDLIDDLTIEEEELLKRKNLSQDNAVQIITIHMSKGLEFSIVFALGLINRINPDPLLSDEEVLELDAEKMRQFYVALTRAKNRVYIPFVIDQNKKVLKIGQASSIELFLKNAFQKEIIDLPTFENGLSKLAKNISITYLKEKTTFHEHKKISFTYSFSNPSLTPDSTKIFSFSSISNKEISLDADAFETDILESFYPNEFVDDPTFIRLEKGDKEPIFYPYNVLPGGVETGIILHAILEKTLMEKDLHIANNLLAFIQKKLSSTSLYGFEEVVFQMTKQVLFSPIFESFGCRDLSRDHMQVEMEVLFPLRKGDKIDDYFKGIIDLAFYYQDKYYLVDWKSNCLEGYSQYDLEQEIEKHEYDLQASIYIEAFRRYIENVEKKSFDQSFGGYYLIFLRGLSTGEGVYTLTKEKLKTKGEIHAILSDRK